MLILHDHSTLLHATIELLGARLISALESPDRITAILSSLSTSHHEVSVINFNPTSRASHLLTLLTTTHSPAYLIHLRTIFQTWLDADLVEPSGSVLPECFAFPTGTGTAPSEPKDIFARVGFYAFDMSSGITSTTYLSTLASANLAYEGVHLLTSSPSPSPAPTTLIALTRPPGHHCDGSRAGGYCYVNNAALAVSAYRHHLPSPPDPKIAILDLDFHHGNGTQSIFYTDPSVLYVSIHGQDEFPYYTGSPSETGAGPGLGYNLNLPLKPGSSFADYQTLLTVALDTIATHRADFLIISLGFDTFELDPLGKFAIETRDYQAMARQVRRELMRDAERGAGGVGKCLILLEGGYVVEKLGDNLLSFLRGWEEG